MSINMSLPGLDAGRHDRALGKSINDNPFSQMSKEYADGWRTGWMQKDAEYRRKHIAELIKLIEGLSNPWEMEDENIKEWAYKADRLLGKCERFLIKLQERAGA